MVSACGFSVNPNDSQVFQWILLQDSVVNLLAWCSESSLDLWAFQDSAKVCIEHLVCGKVVVTLEGGSFMSSATQIIQLAQSTFSPRAETAQMPTRSKFQNAQFAYIKQSHSRDVWEGFDDAIDDAKSPALDATVSHFALASSRSLRGIELLYIIPGLKFLKKQNSLPGLLVAFNCTFNHQRKVRNFLSTMTCRRAQRW